MEGVKHDQMIGKGSAVAIKGFPPSYANAMRTAPTNDASSGASVSMQTNQTPVHSFSGSGCGNSNSGSGCGNSNSVSADVSQSNGSRMVSTRYYTRQHVPSKPAGRAELPRGPAWLLIEWERPTGGPHSYDVIASTQIVDRTPDRLDQTVEEGRKKKDAEYYTGNLIHVQRGQHVLPATIVMVSDDKKFIETELRQLRKMATHNLNTNPNAQISSVQRQQNSSTLEQQMYSQMHRGDSDRGVQFPEWKHRATVQHHAEHQDTVPAKKRIRNDSESSYRESSSPCPTVSEASHRTGALSAERTITPRSDRAVRSNAVKPMTFDQQTQTIGTATIAGVSGHDAQLAKVLSYLESIMAEQKRCQMEREYDRKLLHDLHEKQVVHEEMLSRIEEKITLERKSNHTNPDNGGTVPGKVPDNGKAIELSLIDRCLMTDEDGQLLCEYRYDENGFIDDSARETVTEVHLDANRNQSWMPSVDATTKTVRVASNNTASIDTGGSALVETANASCSIVAATENYVFPPSDQSTTPGVEVKQFDLIDDLKKDWNDHVGNEEEEEGLDQSNGDGEKSPSRLAETAKSGSGEEMVSIGAHGTLVKQSALDKIKWSNYKSATRKLLMEVFGREMLATHSLSGRPSPALRGNADKPVKDRLEPNVVADVTEMVCKMCNANESLVRNVITAKCADENKMSKQRAGLMPQRVAPPKKLEPGSVVPAIVDNKENILNGRG